MTPRTYPDGEALDMKRARTAVPLYDPTEFARAVWTPGTYTFDADDEVADALLPYLRKRADEAGHRVIRVVRAGRTYWFDVVAT